MGEGELYGIEVSNNFFSRPGRRIVGVSSTEDRIPDNSRHVRGRAKCVKKNPGNKQQDREGSNEHARAISFFDIDIGLFRYLQPRAVIAS